MRTRLNRGAWSRIRFLTFSISAYRERKLLPNFSTKCISSMAKSERRLAKRGSSSTLALNFFDKAISGLVKTWVYFSQAIDYWTAFWLFSPVKAMAFPLGMQLIIVFCSAWRSLRGLRMMTMPVGSNINGKSWKTRLFSNLVLARSKRSLCS